MLKQKAARRAVKVQRHTAVVYYSHHAKLFRQALLLQMVLLAPDLMTKTGLLSVILQRLLTNQSPLHFWTHGTNRQ